MNIIDLTHPISEDMPVYPGTEQPRLHLGCTLKEDGFVEKIITMYSHTGTHIDAPSHLIAGGSCLDELEFSHFFGSAAILKVAADISGGIELESLLALQATIEEVDFLLVHTGWSNFWGEQKYFSGYPVFTPEAAEWLSKQGVKGVGFDTISADHADTTGYPIHNIFLGANMIIVENLVGLGSLPSKSFNFSCFPLKLEAADGSPVRAVAYLA